MVTKTRFILELGCNHQGDIGIAKKMIDDAERLGIWAVKLQKRDIDGMNEYLKKSPRDIADSFGMTYGEHRAALELSVKEINELIDYTHAKEINIGVSVFDMPSAKEMSELPFDFIKLPSQFLTDYALNHFLLDHQGIDTIIVSTGMHTMDEILNWHYLERYSVVMYCRSLYPCPVDKVNFGQFKKLQTRLNADQAIGYSSHEVDGAAIADAVLLGAEYIERHYTLDKTMKGRDHKTVSSDYKDMERILNQVMDVEAKLENLADDYLSEEEKKVRKIFRGF
jgi:sialic acid synthase SpsE